MSLKTVRALVLTARITAFLSLAACSAYRAPAGLGGATLDDALYGAVATTVSSATSSSYANVDACATLPSSDAYLKTAPNQWRLGSSLVEALIETRSGGLYVSSLTDKETGRNVLPPGGYAFSFFDPANDATFGSSTWAYVSSEQKTLSQGELQLGVTLQNGRMRTTQYFIAYPCSSIIRQWATHTNAGTTPMIVTLPRFFNGAMNFSGHDQTHLIWMTGGGNMPYSWTPIGESVTAGKLRIFDSNDPFYGDTNKQKLFAGSSSYAPWYAFWDKTTRQGAFIGWDYFGHWVSWFYPDGAGNLYAGLALQNFKRKLNVGETITMPMSFMGLFHDDLDDAGNKLLAWQYRYLWDYTRDKWFPKVRMVGPSWWNGTSWDWTFQTYSTGTQKDFPNVYDKAFRTADLMRYTGGDVFNRDWGWWSQAGEWKGPDFGKVSQYLSQYDMRMLIYAHIYWVDTTSAISRTYPGWLIDKYLIDMNLPGAVSYLNGVLDDFTARWGDFAWRNDWYMTGFRFADEEHILLGQDQNMRSIIRRFLDKNPGSTFQAVNFGGIYAGYDYLRYAMVCSMSDGKVGPQGNYYASLLFPPDKLADYFDMYPPDQFHPTWYRLLASNMEFSGDTWNLEKLEGMRDLIAQYHYLKQNGVAGRWVWTYRPSVSGDRPDLYFQRLSQDRKKGIIVLKHYINDVSVPSWVPALTLPSQATVYPKGLLGSESYVVNFRVSDRVETRTGADLMANGITVTPGNGELIYLNLPLHPGSKIDKQAPTGPTAVTKAAATHMDTFPGVEVRWKAGTDDNFIAYYEILRDNAFIERIAKGTFFFDHSAGADAAASYCVRTVDGAGNTSACAGATGTATKRAVVLDDNDKSITYKGAWSTADRPYVTHGGSLACAKSAGDTATLSFTGGKRVVWVTRMGANQGHVQVNLSGEKTNIDLYRSDDVWQRPVYSKEGLDPSKTYTLTVAVLGKKRAASTDTWVCLDGVRVEAQ